MSEARAESRVLRQDQKFRGFENSQKDPLINNKFEKDEKLR